MAKPCVRWKITHECNNNASQHWWIACMDAIACGIFRPVQTIMIHHIFLSIKANATKAYTTNTYTQSVRLYTLTQHNASQYWWIACMDAIACGLFRPVQTIMVHHIFLSVKANTTKPYTTSTYIKVYDYVHLCVHQCTPAYIYVHIYVHTPMRTPVHTIRCTLV